MTEAIEIIGRASATTTSQAPLRRKTLPERGDPRYGKSSVTNGRRMHPLPTAGDAAWSRRFRDIYNLLIGDIDNEGARQQARRCATIALACERLESDSAAGKEIDLPLYSTLTQTYGQAIQRLYDLRSLQQQHCPAVTLDAVALDNAERVSAAKGDEP